MTPPHPERAPATARLIAAGEELFSIAVAALLQDAVDREATNAAMQEWTRAQAEASVPAAPLHLKAVKALERVAGLSEPDIRDYEQGLCFFCGEGWEWVAGPRGGKGKLDHTNRHAHNCMYVEARAILPKIREAT